MNARRGGTLAEAIARAIPESLVTTVWAFLTKGAGVALQAKGGPGAEALAQALAPNTTPSQVIIAYANSGATRPTIIIDEANLALGDANRVETKATLELLTTLTKEESKLNVLLVSSEHTYPFTLDGLGYNARSFTKTVFASEVPPAAMRALLAQCGMKPHLTDAFLSCFGGHIWAVRNAIDLLMQEKTEMVPEIALGPTISAGVLTCLDAELTSPVEYKGMTELLTQLVGSLP